MAAKIMRKVLASIALVSVLSAQIIAANALPLSDDLTSKTVNRTVAMLDEEGAKKPIGENAQATFGGLSVGKQDLAQVDLTGGQYVEFQFYVSDYEALKAAMEAAGDKVDTLQLILGSNDSGAKGSVTCKFFDQVKQDGWTDIRIIKADLPENNINWALVTDWSLAFGGKDPAGAAVGDAYAVELGVKNLRTAFFRPVPVAPSSALDTMKCEPLFKSIGKGKSDAQCQWIVDYFNGINLAPADFSKAAFVEFDFYISDYDAVKGLMDASGEKVTAFRLSLGSKPGNMYEERAVYDFQAQVKKTDTGWNHIKIPIGDFFNLGVDWSKVSTWFIGFEGPGMLGYPLGDVYNVVFGAANICATPEADPRPGNAVVTFDPEETSATLGNGEVDAQFHYFSDILYKVGLPAKDFSNADFVELDLYISDYETLKSVVDASDGKVSDLLFCIGSKEGDRYANRWGASIWPLLADVGEDGWVHLRLKKDAFQNVGSGPLDWTKACTWGFSFNGSGFVGLPVGDAWDVRITVKNIYGTAKDVLVQPDPDKPAKPDKDAIYLSDCEKMVEENGDSWNPATVQIDTTYKTEGKASVSQKFMQQPDTSNVMRYVFEQKDFSKVKTLKFDVFVDDLDLMAKTKFAVSLTGDNRGTSKYFRWDVDTTSWKPGWNSVEIDVTKGFTKDDGADMSKIRCFVFGAKDSAFAEGDELIVRLDNLRVTGSLDAGDPSNPSNPSTPEDPSSPTENESSTAGDPTGSESENPGTGAATGAAAFAVMAAAGGALLVSRRRGK